MENRIKELEKMNGEQNLQLCIEDERINSFGAKLDLMAKNMDDKFDIVFERFDKIEEQQKEDRKQIQRIEEKQDKKYWYYIAFITSLLATLIAIFRV